MTPPDSGEREVSTAGCAHKPNWLTCELCNAALSVCLSLSLAQRILAALEVEAYAKAGEEEYRAVFRALAAALRERMPK